jgi:GT2 family glycosyltransferase
MSESNSIIIVNFNAIDSLRALLASLDLSQATTTEVIVVDNALTDDSRKMVRQEFPGVKLLKQETNRGFGAAVITGLNEASGDVVAICHSDVIATVHVITEMCDRVREGRGARRVAAVVPRLIGLDRQEVPSAAKLPGLARGIMGVFAPDKARSTFVPQLDHVADHEWALCACAAFDRDVLDSVGGFDQNFFMYYADADLCRRLHDRSYRILFARDLAVVHGKQYAASAMPPHLGRLLRKDQLRYFAKHHPKWHGHFLAGAMKLRNMVKPEDA